MIKAPDDTVDMLRIGVVGITRLVLSAFMTSVLALVIWRRD